jgi:protein-glucosylgalactosylhydroxylysine glucosidase
MDSRGERIVSYDDYHPTHEKGETPDPLAAFFPVGYEAPPDVERRTVDYYLELADDYIGSPMLSALYGVWAARIGDRRRATKLLDEGYAKFVSDRFMNTHEWRHDKFPEYPRAGPFIANLGGFIVSLIYGFPRLVAGAGDLDTWCRGPIVMPDAWDSIEISRLILRGREVRLVAKDGEPRAHIEIGEACIP